MGSFYWEKEWAGILAEQETLLQYPEFTRETALELGLNIIKLAGETFHKTAAIRIVEDGVIVFAHKMTGTSAENDWWTDRKLAVSRITGMSSLRSYVEAEAGRLDPVWLKRPENFAACGGCIPIFPAGGEKPWAHVIVSNLEHYEDHQIAADAMALQLGLHIPRIVRTA